MTRQVLVAEDDDAVGETIARGLRGHGYECARAASGVEALERFCSVAPDAMVLDLNLPGVHGLEVLRQVKERWPETVVVVLTGHGTEQTAIRALKLGADDYFQKPVRLGVLAQSLHKGLDRAERERRAGASNARWTHLPHQRLSWAFREAPAALVYADERGQIAALNRVATRLLGEVSREILGRRLEEFLVSPLQPGWLDALLAEAGKGQGQSMELMLRGPGGLNVPVSLTAAEGAEGAGTVFCLQDLTRQKAMELHYFETRKLASLGRVVEGVAHEVRNPLTSIGGFARKLLDTVGADGRNRRYLEVILADVGRLEHMVQEIEEYVAFTHRSRRAFSPVDVGAVLSRALERTAARLGPEGVEVRWDRPSAVPPIFADEALLGELFESLAENAFEAMPQGGVLSAAIEAEGNWVRVRLTDTGGGISQEDLPEIFNPFVTSKTSGAGLGLAKAFIIVEDHSGTIEFESRSGAGTACSVSLPVDRRRLPRTAT